MNLSTDLRSKILKICVICVLVVVSAYLIIGTGRIAHPFLNPIFYLNVLYLSFSIWLFAHFKRAFWLVFIVLVFMAFYAPVGILQGPVNEAFVMSIFATYKSEAGEFLKILPFQYIAFSLFSLIFIVAFWYFTPKNRLSKRAVLWCMAIFVIATASGKIWRIAPTNSFIKAVKYFDRSYKDMKLYKQTKIVPAWRIQSVSPRYKNYVVVIGESMRRDYMGLYGYPVADTPFLSEVNGLFVEGYNSVGINTIPALKPVLNLYGDMNLNIVDLANLAGFKTYWLSNQGFIGFWDTANTLIAKRAQSVYFTHMDANLSAAKDGKIYDSDMLDKLREALDDDASSRVIFMHLIGSHPITCSKLKSQEYKSYPDKRTFKINCYVQSIRQTDDDLAQIYAHLQRNFKEKGESFSMIYFSDHGLTHNYKKNPPELLIMTDLAKEHLQIPLVKLSSDDTGRIVVKNRSFANFFPQSYAHWLGVEAENFSYLKDSAQGDVFKSGEQIDVLESQAGLILNKKGDPYIDISKFLKR